MVVHNNSFKLHFSSRPTDEQGNKNMGGYADAMAHGKASEAKLLTLTGDKDYFVLGADGRGNIVAFHSLRNVGGTLARPTHKVFGLVGLGNNAVPVIFDEATLTASCEITTPPKETILNCSTVEELTALQPPVSTRNNLTFEGSNAIILPPWARIAFVNADSSDAFETILAITAAAKAFDTEHDGVEGIPSALEYASDIAAFAFGVKHKLVPATTFQIGVDDPEAVAYSAERHAQCIMPAIAGPGQPGAGAAAGDGTVLAQLSATMSRQNELHETSLDLRKKEIDRQVEKDAEKKDKSSKMHDRVLHMLRMAAGADAEDDKAEIAEAYKKFLNSDSAAQAALELLEQFQTRGHEDVNFAHGTVQALYNGQLQYSIGSTPSNFTAFAFCEQDPLLGNEIQRRSLTLTLVKQIGVGATLDEINKSSKQVVALPETYDELYNQVDLFKAAWEVIGGPDSRFVEQLDIFLGELKKTKHAIKAHLISDEMFAAKILFAVDRSSQLYLESCRRADDRSEVDDSCADLTEITRAISHCRFTLLLPPSFKSIKDSSTELVDPDAPPGNSRRRKSKRKSTEITPGDGTNPYLVVNNEPIEGLALQEADSFTDTFGGKLIEQRPTWPGGRKMCVKWHLKHSCFKNCIHAASHVPSSKVPEPKKAEMKRYLEKVRGL